MKFFLKIPYVFRLIIFWLVYFISFRVLFIIYQHAKIPDDVHSETGLGFLYALPVDISVSCVMAFIPFLLWIFQQYNKSRIIHQINLTYNFTLIILTSLLSVTNIKMYGEWGELLSIDILRNLFHPSNSLSFFSLWSVILLLAFSAIISIVGIRFYRNYITNFSYPVESKKVRTAQIIFIALGLLAGYRIDLNIASIKGNRIHYSELEINNHLATNNIWYFANSLVYRNNKAQ
ncbi:MAG: phosphoglycerol transferase family protein alkaline phosphatase superfamily [Bacteroidetes bacterium]|nr:phosphoglycerol transferase family protein alkaline phosphatase superfamily [Bacteroidota bacterium]